MIRNIQDVSTALEDIVGGFAPSIVSVLSHRAQAVKIHSISEATER